MATRIRGNYFTPFLLLYHDVPPAAALAAFSPRGGAGRGRRQCIAPTSLPRPPRGHAEAHLLGAHRGQLREPPAQVQRARARVRVLLERGDRAPVLHDARRPGAGCHALHVPPRGAAGLQEPKVQRQSEGGQKLARRGGGVPASRAAAAHRQGERHEPGRAGAAGLQGAATSGLRDARADAARAAGHERRVRALHGGEPREKTFFDLVDADGDGLISYPEYMFFNTLLAIPERQFELAFKMFDTDDNGKLDHREFKQVGDGGGYHGADAVAHACWSSGPLAA
ncbi:hypothetical protein ON010_g18258 [Phytophthora cinnamomi]|nr:hypothetical protein ON010_g18258 [Phytophthora cinnamomi]